MHDKVQTMGTVVNQTRAGICHSVLMATSCTSSICASFKSADNVNLHFQSFSEQMSIFSEQMSHYSSNYAQGVARGTGDVWSVSESTRSRPGEIFYHNRFVMMYDVIV